MPAIPLAHGGLGFGQTFATSTYGTTLTAHATNNAKGTAVELIAATAYDAHWVEVMAGNPSAAFSYAFDILIGSATEAVLIPNLTFKPRAANDGGGRWLFPLFVPKGSRIAAQCASSGGTATMIVAVNLFNAGIAAPGMATVVDQYGTLTNSLGVNVDPGAVAHTDVTVEMTASTVRPHSWLVLTIAGAGTGYGGATKWLVDVCVGASTEVDILSDYPIGGGGTGDNPRPDQVVHVPAFVPQGSRLTVRARCSVTTDVTRDLHCTVHGC